MVISKPAPSLRTEALHFLDCIRTGQQPLSDGLAGVRVLRILEAASESLALGGRPVELSPLEVAA